MAFSCKKDNQAIYSFQYDLKDWIALKEDKNADFTMPCCGCQAILKTSKLGTQFFAHKVNPKDSDCSTGGESDEHMDIKRLVMQELARNGWNVEVEKRGATPNGEEWIADIYAEKGKAKITIEVQWSPQTFIETKRRQEKYAQSGVRCAWLLRSGSIKARNAIVGDYAYSTKDMPVFSIYKDKEKGYMVYNVYESTVNNYNYLDFLSYNYLRSLEAIQLSVNDFILNLVTRKIVFKNRKLTIKNKFVLIKKNLIEVFLIMGSFVCPLCYKNNNIVRSINYINRHEEKSRQLSKLNNKEIEDVNRYFSSIYNFAPIRKVHSEILNRSFIVNSCIKCGATIRSDFLGYKRTKSIFIRNKGRCNENVFHFEPMLDGNCVKYIDTMKNIKNFKNMKLEETEILKRGKWILTVTE